MTKFRTLLTSTFFLLLACGAENPLLAQNNSFTVTEVVDFDQPWAMTFMPDGRLLVSEKQGALKVYDLDSGAMGDITGVPEVRSAGQGGFADIVLHPDYASNNMVYMSFTESGRGGAGAAVARATLALNGNDGELQNLEVIWRQFPKVSGNGHFSQRIAFYDGYLWISSGDRQKFDPAQDMEMNLGKIMRLNYDGSVPSDNPFADQDGVAAQVWSLGHRNPLGLAFDANGQPWNVEMGPMGGDEINRVVRGGNYGYPIVSNGDHYSGERIADHSTRPEFDAPAAWWNPVISPSSLMFYSGSEFPQWQGNAFIGGLSSESLVRIEFNGEQATEAQRFDMNQRIREVEQGPDGAIYVLEDQRQIRGSGGRLLKLTARD
ncbi:MAG: PQQ-dependent sugar dehydrogenase [Gammaproteobacteria bacterium]|nr:PQQ-dependent sugar dehydrogenase [Gammaproteobacteria bacterium]